MALPQGINFRNTAGFVTDISPAYGETSVLLNYPTTTPQGNSVGWERDGSSDRQYRDRNSGVDARFAGKMYNPIADDTYRIDLPSAGNYNIRMAAGEMSYVVATHIVVKDGTTSFGEFASSNTTAAGKFRDAVDAEYSDTTWVTSNTAVTKSFATTICRIFISTSLGSNIAHFYIETGAATAPTPCNAKRRDLRPSIFRPGLAR